MVALVTCPISAADLFWIVALWNDPSMVVGHLTVFLPRNELDTNSRFLQVNLKVLAFRESRPAVVVPTVMASADAARMQAAASRVERDIVAPF